MSLKQLREQAAGLVAQQRSILNDITASETRAMSAEQEATFDKIEKDLAALEKTIALTERQEAREKEMAGLVITDEKTKTEERTEETLKPEERCEAFRLWALGADYRFQPTDKQQNLLKRAGLDIKSNTASLKFTPETRALSVSTPSAGGYLVPEGFVPSLEKALIAWGNVRGAATVIRTATGNPLPFPTANDTANVGALLGENIAVSEQDTTFAEMVLDAYKFSSKAIRVSMELLQDSAFNLEAYIGGILGERIGKIQNQYYTTGTGSSQPNGIVTASTLGKSAASATAVTFPELVDLEHSVNAVYRNGGKFMFADSTLAALKKLVDGSSRPLWQAGLGSTWQVGAPATILGYPYVVNYDMPAMASSGKSILFGDLSKYYVRECTEIILQRLVERYAEYHQVGFLAVMRADADLLDAGTHPVKYLQQAA